MVRVGVSGADLRNVAVVALLLYKLGALNGYLELRRSSLTVLPISLGIHPY